MIAIKSKREIEAMRESARRLKAIFDNLIRQIKAGVSTLELDQLATKLINEQKAVSAFKGYRGYPAQICTSLNEEVVHGIPSKKRVLKAGDILSVDMGILYGGYYSDAARTISIGKVSEEARELIDVTRQAFFIGMNEMRPGKRVGDVSAAIQAHVESNGFSVIRDFVGHGIGRALHEDPQVPNFGKSGSGYKLEPGMAIALEPMVAAGNWEIEILDDAWTVVTRDRQIAAHYEDTVVVTENGPLNLTGPQTCDE